MIGKTLGHYRVVEKLGAGGMGDVYKARDTHLDRFVALKILPPEKVADPDRKRRFVQEAKAASALNHPNIIHIYDIANAEGIDFIAMEYVAGKTLDRVVGRKGLGVNEALGHAIPIADALAKAHSAGIVHRDLKPANIMVNEDGTVKILDFGLAKLTEPGSGEPSATTETADAGAEAHTESWRPSFAPDGAMILYTEVLDPMSFGPSKMFLIPAQGGTPKSFQPEFVVLPHIGSGPVAIWSPDGKHVLFQGARVDDPKTRDWWVAPLNGGSPVATGAARTILQSPEPIYPMAWFRNWIIFGKGTTVEGFNLLCSEITPGSWQVSTELRLITTGPGMKYDPSVARDGSMVFVNGKAVVALWSIPLDPDSGKAAGAPSQISQDELVKTQPTISRNGSKLAYGAYGTGRVGGMEMRVKSMSDGRETSITMGSTAYLFSPQLSPNGSALAYRDYVDNKWRSYLITGETAASRQICEDCYIRSICTDPAEAIIQYGNELVRQNLNSGNRIPVLKASAGVIHDAVASPDDKWLAFQLSKPAGGYAIYLCPMRDQLVLEQDWLLAAEETSYQQSPRWAANGNLLYFISERDGYGCIWTQRLDPATKRPLGDAVAFHHEHRSRFWINWPRGWESISVSRDKLIFGLMEMTANIWLTNLDVK